MSNKPNSTRIPFKVPFIFRLIRRFYPTMEKYASPLANRLAVFVFFFPMRFKMPPKEKQSYHNATISHFRIAGKKIHAYVWGDGPSVLMTHGWSGRGTQFKDFIKPFNDAGYRVVSFDGPAHGMSQGKSTNILEFGETIHKLSVTYGPFCAMIGHSFGGVANLYAQTEGLNCPKMIMISSPTITDDIIADALNKLDASPKRGEFLKNYIFRKFGAHFEEVGALKLYGKVENTPLLLIHDIQDKEVPIKHPEKLKDKYPGIELIRTEGFGHVRILKSRDVVQYCLDFIK